MTKQRFILEMGIGNDLHGEDYHKAAARAVESAMRRSTLPIFDTLGLDHSDMDVRVTIAVQQPEQLDTHALAALMPRGVAQVQAVKGGQNIENPQSGETIVVATAAIEAFYTNQSDHWVAG
ncbi:MAG: Lin0512 family protein [Pseudomonadota bacterium]